MKAVITSALFTAVSFITESGTKEVLSKYSSNKQAIGISIVAR